MFNQSKFLGSLQEPHHTLHYFRGTIRGVEYVSTWKEATSSIAVIDGYKWYYFGFNYDWDRYFLGFSIPFQTGVLPMEDPNGDYRIDQSIPSMRLRDKQTGYSYVPKTGSMYFYVQKLYVDQNHSGLPYVEGNMEGFLYNEECPEDSLFIGDAVFGAH